ncbi:uncharacterized protein PV09_04860 [Verruconis gallopava]|uniref:Uncharacterized protein n=1 Tax=Verruconis gallopava TaxID=253628 RepID=A0A0D2AB88_9PEZI|nr:uncharacterized protein PV09_04860 [Verruconis gallopava]KIW04038.1 hypothetical protein PV09_04860 [Verruconis gallopava]
MPYAIRLSKNLLGSSDAGEFTDHLRALEWSHSVLRVLDDLPLMRISEIWQIWSELWVNVAQSAVTPNQKVLGLELLHRSKQVEDALRHEPQWIQCSSFIDENDGAQLYKQLRKLIGEMLDKAAEDFGFSIVDEFLVHPNETPLSQVFSP